MSDNRVGSFCPEHGINCKIDDDGTCSACGASAVGTALDEIERLKARVEELKKSNLDKALLAVQSDHHITDEQIDAAWQYAMKLDSPTLVLAALAELGIKRCEGCEDGHIAVDTGDPQDSASVTCPDCNGHGWVVKDA